MTVFTVHHTTTYRYKRPIKPGVHQLMFRPLAVWAERFRFEQTAGYAAPESWSLRMLRTSRVIAVLRKPAGRWLRAFATAVRRSRCSDARDAARCCGTRTSTRAWCP